MNEMDDVRCKLLSSRIQSVDIEQKMKVVWFSPLYLRKG